jgi:hypothetical protein
MWALGGGLVGSASTALVGFVVARRGQRAASGTRHLAAVLEAGSATTTW